MLAFLCWIWFFCLSLDFMGLKMGYSLLAQFSQGGIFIVFVPTLLLGMLTLNPALKIVGRDLLGLAFFRRMWTSSPLQVKLLLPVVFGNALYLMFATQGRQAMDITMLAISMWLALVSAVCASYILPRR